MPSLHCNFIQYPVILNNGSETTPAFYKLQTGLMKLGRAVDPKQPPFCKIYLLDI